VSAETELAKLLGRDGELELPSLHDDELAALDPLEPADLQLVPLATHEGLSEQERAGRAVHGEASLLARGLLAEHGDRVAPTNELQALLSARDAPATVTLVDILEDGALRPRVVYAVEPGVVLTERVDDGVHSFALRTPAMAAAALASEIDRADRAGTRDGEPLVYTTSGHPESWAEVEEAAANAERSVRLYTAQRTGDAEVRDYETSVVVGGSGVWMIGGVLDTRTGDGEVHARQLSRASLEELLREFVAPP
jgi:hypothetical protein